jgi:hypothetical protein
MKSVRQARSQFWAITDGDKIEAAETSTKESRAFGSLPVGKTVIFLFSCDLFTKGGLQAYRLFPLLARNIQNRTYCSAKIRLKALKGLVNGSG